MSELLDFTGRKDFEDLKFGKGYNLTQDDIVAFKEDCMRIKNTNDKMALEQCKLGLQLAELKAGKTWQSVINQKTGFAYLVHSFEDFCKDTFKFSGTKTYALMQIAKFVTSNSENEVHFIDEKYSEFSSSQLTELASVPTYNRHLFTPNMTVDDMRTIKKYIVKDAFWYDKQKEDFDLLTYAKAYVESKKTPKALPASKPDVLPGQQSIFPEDNEDESEIFPTSGKSENGEEIDAGNQSDKIVPMSEDYIEKARQAAHAAGLPFYEGDADEFDPYVFDGKMSVEDYKLMHKLRTEKVNEYDETDEAQEDMHAEMETIEADAEKSVSQTPRVDLSNRAKIREFLSDFQNWSTPRSAYTFMKEYYYPFKNGMGIYAILFPGCSDMEKMQSDHSTVRYYLKRTDGVVFEVTKDQIEKYMLTHKEEVRGW